MVKRDELAAWLESFYEYGKFQDYCRNGLQVEGPPEIHRIVFGVSLNLPLLERAVFFGADALIVHHGVFGQDFFSLTGALKEKVSLLLQNGVSLFGVHLPMDAHPAAGHNALLLSWLGAENTVPFEVGYMGDNVRGHSLDDILAILHQKLHDNDSIVFPPMERDNLFSFSVRHGFQTLGNGPDVPRRIAAVSGGAAGSYKNAAALGADTFITGEIKESTPALSLETRTNYINLGHYYSEKPGVLALRDLIARRFKVEALFCELPNPV